MRIKRTRADSIYLGLADLSDPDVKYKFFIDIQNVVNLSGAWFVAVLGRCSKAHQLGQQLGLGTELFGDLSQVCVEQLHKNPKALGGQRKIAG